MLFTVFSRVDEQQSKSLVKTESRLVTHSELLHTIHSSIAPNAWSPVGT